MNQSFKPYQLERHLTLSEIRETIGNRDLFKEELNEVYSSIIDETFEFEIVKKNDFYLIDNIAQKLVLRKLNDNIKRTYKSVQANRKLIIRQVKTLISETCPFWILKTDIKSFYESVDREILISKLQDDILLSYHSVYLLEKMFSNGSIASNEGLPRGMNISASLSEIYMRRFDRYIKREKDVYYYARFVDDIIIFTNTLQSARTLRDNLNEILIETAPGLKINESKTNLYSGYDLKLIMENNNSAINCNVLEYLGYSFSNKSICNHKSKFTISIADKKIKKIKTRIVKSFLDYAKNKDFNLLENRIKFLTGNYIIKKSPEGNTLKAGLFYNYDLINEKVVFDELNLFYKKTLYSNTRNFGNKIGLTKCQKERLKKYCFKKGFENKINRDFCYKEMKTIINCW